MRKEHLHATDEELLLHAEGEMCAGSASRIRAHLEDCSQCRNRLSELEGALAEVGEAQRAACDAELPVGAGPRALLKARLAELTVQERQNVWARFGAVLGGYGGTAVLAGVGIALFFVVLNLVVVNPRPGVGRYGPVQTALGHWEEPDLRLTPGATVPVTAGEVCRADTEKATPAVPVSLKRKVFEEYGVTPPRPDAYEVDYLITPELGGATDIRNLWPEPYEDTVWNAHVKDQLEDRLHQMVCRGDVDLATAQRDISTDWIAAYRKYFHADRPVEDGSSSDFSSFRRSLPST
jgi:hypothetical protein